MSPQRKNKPAPVTAGTGLAIMGVASAVAGKIGTGITPQPGPGLQTGSTGNAQLDAAFAQLVAAGPGGATSKYDANADIYGYGVVSSTPVSIRYKPTQSQIVSTMGNPADLNMAQSNVGSQMQRLYAMAPGEVAQWQRKLYEGGFYSNGMKMSDITPGVVDSETEKAWYGAVITAARYSQGGKQTTIEDVIDMTAQALDYAGPKGPAAPYEPTRLTDPAALRAMADQISTNLLGRRLTDQEKQALVDKVHGSEAGFYGSVRAKAQTLTDVDPQAQIQESIQQDFKPEYDATNVANTYDIFSQIIGGSKR